ncbi:S-adenosyl-L-methionine-dependent methyltransferase [Trichoderma camerunense]
MASSSKPAHLDPSELGTKEYWDKLYTTELTNHAANPSDTGTNWFDDSDAEGRIVAFLDALTEDDQDILEKPLSKEDAALMDLGCGNGELLFALRDDGWEGQMLGVDYSAQSVALAKRIGETRDAQDEEEEQSEEKEGEAEKTPSVRFLEWDLLAGPVSPNDASSPLSIAPSQETLFDIILDKGTFDAISLSAGLSSSDENANPCETYRKRLLQLLNPNGGVFLVTSCNWTEPELRSWFEEDEDGELSVVGRVEYPTFTFGGVKGQTITTLCFRRGKVSE